MTDKMPDEIWVDNDYKPDEGLNRFSEKEKSWRIKYIRSDLVPKDLWEFMLRMKELQEENKRLREAVRDLAGCLTDSLPFIGFTSASDSKRKRAYTISLDKHAETIKECGG